MSHRRGGGPLSPEEEASFQQLVRVTLHHFLPFITNCFSSLFTKPPLTTFTLTTTLTPSHPHTSSRASSEWEELDVVAIATPLRSLCPEVFAELEQLSEDHVTDITDHVTDIEGHVTSVGDHVTELEGQVTSTGSDAIGHVTDHMTHQENATKQEQSVENTGNKTASDTSNGDHVTNDGDHVTTAVDHVTQLAPPTAITPSIPEPPTINLTSSNTPTS